MGANCCVAARSKPLSTRSEAEISLSRNVIFSPSWSFRRHSRTYTEDSYESVVSFPLGNNRIAGPEIKNVHVDIEGQSDGDSPLSSFQAPSWHKSPIIGRAAGRNKDNEDDLHFGRSSTIQENDVATSSTISSIPVPKASIPAPSVSCYDVDTSSSPTCSQPSGPIPSKKPRRSFGYRLYRQISDSRILKPRKDNNMTERRKSFVLSACSNELSTKGSHGESSDGWSMRMFSELVSSQRDRWSFDSENLSSSYGKITRSSSHLLDSPTSSDLQMCWICSKFLRERSPWSSQKLVTTNELPVVAVLCCGHVYHAECLENVTSDMDSHEPPCPLCSNGGKLGSKFLSKAETKARNKLSRIAVGDFDIDSNDSARDQWQLAEKKGKGPKISSGLKNSLSRPFWRRHFSIGSRGPELQPESDNTRRKGFWIRA